MDTLHEILEKNVLKQKKPLMQMAKEVKVQMDKFQLALEAFMQN